jgi:hypothetical protein
VQIGFFDERPELLIGNDYLENLIQIRNSNESTHEKND